MRRVIGIDIHRTFGEVVIWEEGRLRGFGRVDMTRTALEGLGGKLHPTDEVVIEASTPSARRRLRLIRGPHATSALGHSQVSPSKQQGRRTLTCAERSLKTRMRRSCRQRRHKVGLRRR